MNKYTLIAISTIIFAMPTYSMHMQSKALSRALNIVSHLYTPSISLLKHNTVTDFAVCGKHKHFFYALSQYYTSTIGN
jgi:hypothetical protein